MNCESLKKLGYHVKIRHNRLFKRVVKIHSPVSNKIFYDEVRILLTKAQYKFNLEEYKEYELQNNGGLTEVTIFKNEEIIGTGSAKVSPKDNFNRKIALKIAIGRALRNTN